MNTLLIEPTEEEVRANDPNNMALFETGKAAFDAIKGPRVGDYLKLPHGEYTRFTESYDDQLQTGGHAGSRYFLCQNGQLSYSGSLDRGVVRSDIELTDEVKEGLVWFFSQSRAVGQGAVEFQLPCRVYTLKTGADTSGLPQIAAYQRKCRADWAEKVIRAGINGKPVELPLPVVYISRELITQQAFIELCKSLGLDFDCYWWSWFVQPYNQSDIDTILAETGLIGEYRQYGDHPNSLFLKKP